MRLEPLRQRYAITITRSCAMGLPSSGVASTTGYRSMAEPGQIPWARWSIPRLADSPDPDPWATRRRLVYDREAEGWEYLAEWLLVGWCLTPPLYVGETREWVCIAVNVGGCLERRPIVTGVGTDRWTAIDELSAHFEFKTDDGCVRAQRRRPN